jgi:hypothetical protein
MYFVGSRCGCFLDQVPMRRCWAEIERFRYINGAFKCVVTLFPRYSSSPACPGKIVTEIEPCLRAAVIPVTIPQSAQRTAHRTEAGTEAETEAETETETKTEARQEIIAILFADDACSSRTSFRECCFRVWRGCLDATVHHHIMSSSEKRKCRHPFDLGYGSLFD